MEALAILFILGVLAAVIIVPIVALVQALKAKREVQRLRDEWAIAQEREAKREVQRLRDESTIAQEREVQRLRDELRHACAKLESSEQRIRDLAERVGCTPDAPENAEEPLAGAPEHAEPESPPTLSQTGAAETPTVGKPPSESAPVAANEADPAPSDAGSGGVTTDPRPAEAVNVPPRHLDWEGLIGVRMFAWLGGGALFLAAALFLHYSIQQNLISPPIRVALGLTTGALLLALGYRVCAKADLPGQAVAGAGAGTLYAALYASHALYHLLPAAAVFGGMVLVTLAAGMLAVKRGAYLIAVLALIGGMATPFLLSTGEDHPWPLLGYVLLLDVGIAWVSQKRHWPTLALLGFCASILVFIAWASRYLYPQRTPYALAALAIVSALFITLLWNWRSREATAVGSTLRSLAHIAIAAPVVAAFVLSHPMHSNVNPAFLSGYLVVVAVGAAIVAQRVQGRAIPLLVAVLGVACQYARLGHELFPARAVSTLASFSMLPAIHVLIWWHRREATWQRVHLWALVATLASPVLIAPGAVAMQPTAAAVWPIAAHAAIHVSVLLLLALGRGTTALTAVAQTVALVVAFALGQHAGARILPGLSLTLAASGLVFWSLPLVSSRLRPGRTALVVSALALPVQYLLLYVFAHRAWATGPLGAVCVAGGLVMLAGIRRLRHILHERVNDQFAMTALHGALCLALLTAALPILLENQWLTVAFGLEVAALAWLHGRVPHRGLVVAAALLSVGCAIRLLFNPYLWEYPTPSRLPVLNFYLYTFGVVAMSFLFAARRFANVAHSGGPLISRWLKWCSVVLLFVLLNVEIADFYSQSSTIVFRFSGGGLAQDMTYSLAWGLFALALMIIGIVKHDRGTRLGALSVLMLTIAKVFLHDLWQLGALYRVGSIVGLAVALLLVSYLVQRFILRKEQA